MDDLQLTKGYAPDMVVSRRMVSTCVLLAGLGIAIVQMAMLAQVWRLSGHAFPPALVAGAWLAGGVLSFRLPPTLRFWGWVFGGCVLAWLAVSLLTACGRMVLPSSPRSLVLAVLAYGIASLVMGFISSAWLAQSRPWPRAGELVTLARLSLAGTFGLVCVWDFSPSLLVGAGGFVLLLPLLALDAWPATLCPLPVPGGRVEGFLNRARGGTGQARVDRRALAPGWCWTYLAKRGRLPLTLVASAVAVLVGSVWNSVPTAFAGGLAQTNHPATLWWLLAGQVCAVATGTVVLNILGRGVIGAPARMLPEDWHARVRALSLPLLLIMGGCIVALGLPWLQAASALGASLGGYSLAALLWAIFLPRLRPSINTLVTSQRHLFRATAHLSHLVAGEQAMENEVSRVVLTTEGILTAMSVPACGWLIDRWSVDPFLMVAGGVLVGVLVLAAVAFGGGIPAEPSVQYVLMRPDQSTGNTFLTERVFPAAGDREQTARS